MMFTYVNNGGVTMAEVPNRTLQRGLDMLELLGAHAEGLAL